MKLTDGPLTGSVPASDRFRVKAISRADVAWHILALAQDPSPRRLPHPGYHYRRQPLILHGGSRSQWFFPASAYRQLGT